MSCRKDLEALIEKYRALGWSVTYTGAGHYRWVPPNGKGLVFSQSTPGDRRGLKNLRAALRRVDRGSQSRNCYNENQSSVTGSGKNGHG